MDEGKKHPTSETVQGVVDALGDLEALKPKAHYELTDYVEWVVVHKGCGKPLTGHSPRNGWCYCLVSTGMPPILKPKCEHPEITHNTKTNKHRCANENCNEEIEGRKCGLCDDAFKAKYEEAEKEIASLKEKLDKASKKIAELVKKQ